ncbi:MAG: nucleotide exchange factor GrpE, partial [Pyrinomonadaceae bacterium]|nr:nucleotide exchange factor GrpE [Pyrinomonadaceae bacterium]
MLMGLQRRAKDFDAFKARTERERAEIMQNQICDLAGRLLPVIDNLHRAIEFAGGAADTSGDEFRHFYSGMVLVEQQVTEVLASMGIEAIPTLGAQFDPHFHEAVATDETGEVPANTITAELLRGYILGERVIRHSMVKVAVSAHNNTDMPPLPDLLDSPV